MSIVIFDFHFSLLLAHASVNSFASVHVPRASGSKVFRTSRESAPVPARTPSLARRAQSWPRRHLSNAPRFSNDSQRHTFFDLSILADFDVSLGIVELGRYFNFVFLTALYGCFHHFSHPST